MLKEAAELGILHVGFSGGEPLLHRYLAELVSTSRAAGMYTNLITSAVGLTAARAQELASAGLDNVQISLQADEAVLADSIAGARAHAQKLAAAEHVRKTGMALSLNVVLHRGNIERLSAIIALAEELQAERIELANTQYYGWAFLNREHLLPHRAQVEQALQIARDARARLMGKLDILYVLPDYFQLRPKPCLQGWGQRYLTVNPVGDVLPCPTSGAIPGLRFENVQRESLSWIWKESESFRRFRGVEWMPEPCRSCDFREIDFGGCRCQAVLWTGDAAQTDPVCEFSPHRNAVDQLLRKTETGGGGKWQPRLNPEVSPHPRPEAHASRRH